MFVKPSVLYLIYKSRNPSIEILIETSNHEIKTYSTVLTVNLLAIFINNFLWALFVTSSSSLNLIKQMDHSFGTKSVLLEIKYTLISRYFFSGYLSDNSFFINGYRIWTINYEWVMRMYTFTQSLIDYIIK